MATVQHPIDFATPNPPVGFPGGPLESPSQPPVLGDLIEANRYIRQLGLFLEITPNNQDIQAALAEGMLYQNRIVNAIGREQYPDDAHSVGPQGRNDEFALRIAQVVAKQMKPEIKSLQGEFEQGRKELEQRFDRVEKHISEINKRLDGFDKRFDEVDKRFDEVDKRFGGVDKRLDGIDKRFDGVDRQLKEKIRDATQQLESLEKTSSNLLESVGLLNGNQDIRVVFKEVLDLELAGIKAETCTTTTKVTTLTEKFAGVENLAGMETNVVELKGQMKSIVDRITKIERLDLLVINHARILHGPWLEIPNEGGMYPTQQPERFPLLNTHSALEALNGPTLGGYLAFYGLPLPNGITKNPSRWSREQKDAGTKALRDYITTPA
ncbi:myosin-14 [Ceratobasidium sp. AG-Ba]|nr:myosin-14 [Ceratobasidium sp. AG-Ba]